MQALRRYLVTGLVLWVPLGITIWVLATLAVSKLTTPVIVSGSSATGRQLAAQHAGSHGTGRAPLGPMDVRVILDSCLQASMFLTTASSRPDKCRWPSLSMACAATRAG